VGTLCAEHFYIQLRLPGEASCFHFGGRFDGQTHMIIHRTCQPRREQWWLFELESLSFKHATDASVCLNWNTDKGGFDIWKCYLTPKQQFQFDPFKQTYCLRHDPRQCLMASETLSGHELCPPQANSATWACIRLYVSVEGDLCALARRSYWPSATPTWWHKLYRL
jgi:hypothetical protein